MRMILAAAALACASCQSFERVAFTIGYDKATIGIEADLRDPGKNPIARRRHSGK